ncbi:hypothetical protein F4677DRAFT_378293 [Hypoxylon crocopeplum]|nr:hypothetical protein F4677DRAFT_378293 [Hypoxylon crocopeplum]
MASDSSSSRPVRVPKLGHKKSMFGCQRCRARRVKCNEAKPVCYNCKRHGVPCVYDRDSFVQLKASEKPTTVQISPSELKESDPPESRERRMLETRLMHQYVVETGSSVAIDEHTMAFFSRVIPKLAFESDALLYSMYTVSALHMARLGTIEELGVENANVASTYFSMAVREHNNDVSQMSRETADLVSLTSSLMRVVQLVLLQTRCRQPYTPPYEWLAVTQTSASTFEETLGLFGLDNSESPTIQMIKTSWHMHNGKQPRRKNFEQLKHLMDRSGEIRKTEQWDMEIRDAYENALHALCIILRLMDAEGLSGNVLRALVTFPMVVDRRYVELVHAASPRALVILAHYFALLANFEHIWWIANAGADEVRAIAGALSEEWQDMLPEPVKTIEK